MKILINNSNMIFRNASVATQSETKAFTTDDAAIFLMALTIPITSGTEVEVTVTGDDGVVTNNIWNLQLNSQGYATGKTITTNGDSVKFEAGRDVNAIRLQRDGNAKAAGSITLTVKYAYTPNS